MKRIGFFVLLVTVLIWRLPVDLVSVGLQQLSGGQVRLGAGEGTFWNGKGRLDVLDPVAQTWRPWQDVDWSFLPNRLFGGRLGWQTHLGVATVSQLEVWVGGWRGAPLNIGGQVRGIALLMPADLAKIGWHGDFSVHGQDIACDWQGSCKGGLELRWLGAGCDVLPEEVFGDYSIAVVGRPGGLTISWQTLRGAVRIEGTGRWSLGKNIHFEGTVRGEPRLLQRLPAVAGDQVRPMNDHWAVSF